VITVEPSVYTTPFYGEWFNVSRAKLRAFFSASPSDMRRCCYVRALCRAAVLIENVKAGQAPYCRPKPQVDVDDGDVHPDIVTLMKHCWAEEPAERPSFDDVAKSLRTVNKGKSVLVLR